MNMHPRFAALFARLTAGTYLTLDCRDGAHSACETCSCACHSAVFPGPFDRVGAASRAGSTNTTPDGRVEHHVPAHNVGIEGRDD